MTRSVFLPVIGAIEKFTGLKVDYRRGSDVASAISELDFRRQVAVCDIGNGDHSVLINGKCDEWFSTFDPWWYGETRSDNMDLKFLINDPSVNVKIKERHLLANRLSTKAYQIGMAYQMGGKIEKRFVTIMSKG